MLSLGGLGFTDNGTYFLLTLGTGYHEHMPAALTAQPEVRAAPLHQHLVAAAAGVFFFHHQNVPDSNVHLIHAPSFGISL